MRTSTTVAVTLTLASLAGAEPAAGLPWSPPRSIGDADDPAFVDFTNRGAGVAVFMDFGGPTRAAAIDGQHVGPPRPFLPKDLELSEPGLGITVFGKDRILAAGSMRGSVTRPDVRVATGRIGQPLRRSRRIRIPGRRPEREFPSDAGRTVAVAANDRGDAAVLATVCGCGRTPLYVTVRAADGRFGPPLLVTTNAGDVGDFGFWTRPVIAMNERGDALVAWASVGHAGQGTVYVRLLRNGRWRSAAQPVGPMRDSGTLTAALGPGGRAIVTWGTMRASTGGAGVGPLEPVTYFFSYAGRNGHFSAARVIDVGTSRGEFVPGVPEVVPYTPRIEAEFGPDGRAVVAWTGADVDHPVVRAAGVQGSVPDAAQTVAAGSFEALALGPREEAILLWSDEVGGIGASSAPRAAVFGPPEQLWPRGSLSPQQVPLAFNPRTRRALAIWADSPSTASFSVRTPVG